MNNTSKNQIHGINNLSLNNLKGTETNSFYTYPSWREVVALHIITDHKEDEKYFKCVTIDTKDYVDEFS